MAYFNNYNPYQNNVYPQTMYQQMQQGNSFGSPLQKTEIVRVNGRDGANAFQLPPNSETLLLDTKDAIVWLKQTDGAGYATVTPYSIAPYQDEQKQQENQMYMQLDARIRKLEEIVHESNSKSIEHTTNDAANGTD